jgi:Fe-S oxidoreductase/nitrate reductase gamma subunit
MHDASERITRSILGNVPDWLAAAFYLFAFLALAAAAIGIGARLRKHRAGRADQGRQPGMASWGGKIRAAAAYLAFHEQLLEDRLAGVAHLLTFYGFAILFWGTCLVFLEHDTPLHFFYGWFYKIASCIVDLGGLAFLTGLVLFLWRRHVAPPARILRAWWVAALAWLLLAIAVTGFLLEASRIAVDLPDFEVWSIVGFGLAQVLRLVGVTGPAAAALHRWVWGAHAGLCVVFFALLPWKFFSHTIYGLASWAQRRERPRAALATVPLATETLTSPSPPGAVTWQQLTRLDLLQTDACTTCGRCNSVCPAHAAGKPLRPREIVLGLRSAVDHDAGLPLTTWVEDAALWSCTTCAACNAVCPVGIDVYDKIVELRRGRVEIGAVPEAARNVFEGTLVDYNPFQRPASERVSWAGALPLPIARTDEPIELLYWIGCAGSFDAEGRSVAQAMIKILNHLRIGFRVLGERERCSGDPARRLGEEGLFQELARHNLEQFERHRVRQILTHCPHCFNTFRNEYPRLRAGGGDAAAPAFEVVHHTQFLAELIGQGRLRLASAKSGSVTFHDPCYLGRGNGIVDAPRDVLRSTGASLVDMPRHGAGSFCCGAGGGAMWVDIGGRDRVENLRMREAARTGAATVATGCPFCKGMLIAGNQAVNEAGSPATRLRVKDVSELVVEAEGL